MGGDSAVSVLDRLIRPRRGGLIAGIFHFSDRFVARGFEGIGLKRFHLALGVSDMESSAEDHSQRPGCRPDLLIPGKYALWRTDAVNLSIRKMGHEKGGARQGHESGDVVRSGGAI